VSKSVCAADSSALSGGGNRFCGSDGGGRRLLVLSPSLLGGLPVANSLVESGKFKHSHGMQNEELIRTYSYNVQTAAGHCANPPTTVPTFQLRPNLTKRSGLVERRKFFLSIVNHGTTFAIHSKQL
jgi:hypothetical protein